MGLFIAALISIFVLGLVLLMSDLNLSQTRRIESQVRRDTRRIHSTSLRGWSPAHIGIMACVLVVV